ncbi:MAG: translation initiation factor IF-3 [Nitrospirae bacterium]|nr:MAG: translation initiation factor IF-3 [Nitrospirota bacterium]
MAQEYRVNDFIRAKEVRLVDEDGKQIGVVPISEARKLAEERGLDLVEVAPQAKPPVCRILDYGKFKYQQSKKHSHKKTTTLKEVKVRARIDEHDLDLKVRNAIRFLESGHKVKVSLFFRGREIVRPELGMQVFEKFIEKLGDKYSIENKPRQQGKSITMVVAPK